MNIWFTSDPHYFHVNIKKYCPNRPGKDVEEMVEILIKNYNDRVAPGDTVYFLGDIMFGRDKEAGMNNVFPRLNGQKFLLRGNHDHFAKKPWFSRHFEWVKDKYFLRVDHQLIVLQHFPELIWEESHRGSWMLHGHCHGGVDEINRKTTRLDVGVDAEFSNYYPLSFEDVRKIMSEKKYFPIDHHGLRGEME